MQSLQREILDQLRRVNVYDLASQLTDKIFHINQECRRLQGVRIKIDKIDKSDPVLSDPVIIEASETLKDIHSTFKLASPEEINNDFNALGACIDNINALADGFIEEMRKNAYDTQKGPRRNAYATDCCNFLDSCRFAQMNLCETEIIDSTEEHKVINFHKTVLSDLGDKFRIAHIYNAFEEYYPDTWTSERNSERQQQELEELKKRHGLTTREEVIDFVEKQGEGRQKSEVRVKTETGVGKSLSAVQKLLFIRLLQQSGHFPKKPKGTDSAPELQAIALLTGLNYDNDIKGSNGATYKVDKILAGEITQKQITHKLNDLDMVERVAELLNVCSVVIAVQEIKSKIIRNQT